MGPKIIARFELNKTNKGCWFFEMWLNFVIALLNILLQCTPACELVAIDL